MTRGHISETGRPPRSSPRGGTAGALREGFATFEKALSQTSADARLRVFRTLSLGEPKEWIRRGYLTKQELVDRLREIGLGAMLDEDSIQAVLAEMLASDEASFASERHQTNAPKEVHPSGTSTLVRNNTFPSALHEEGYHGVAGELVRAISPHTEAADVAVLVQLLAAIGCIFGRSSFVRVEGDRHPPQLWPVIVGPTAKGRKGTSWGRVSQVVSMVDPDFAGSRIVNGLSTGEGLVFAVRDAVERVNKDGEIELEPGVDDKRLLAIEAEFASPLRHMERGGNTLSATLRSLWDSGNFQSLTKTSPTRTTNSMIAVIGHVTSQELRRYLSRTELGNGFANRFTYVIADRSKVLPFGGGHIDFTPYIQRLRDAVDFAQCDQEIGWSIAGADLWRVEYPTLSEGKPGLFGAVTSRAEAQVLRLALMFALLDCSPVIDVPHLKAACAIWRYSEASARAIFGTSTGNPLADEILGHLQLSGSNGLSRTGISNALGHNKTASAIGQALEELRAWGMIRMIREAKTTRPEERWFVI